MPAPIPAPSSLRARLQLIQWLSPAFPTGAFAYSHGLEQLIADDAIRSAAALEGWLRGVIAFGAGWQDAVLLAEGLRPGADPAALAEYATALAGSAERLMETMDQGRALARMLAPLTGQDLPDAPLPIVLAKAAGALGLAAEEVIALFLHGFAGNLVTIATRAVPLGQSAGQAVLAGLHILIAETATRAASAGLEDLGNGALAADLAAIRHETLDVRLFRT